MGECTAGGGRGEGGAQVRNRVKWRLGAKAPSFPTILIPDTRFEGTRLPHSGRPPGTLSPPERCLHPPPLTEPGTCLLL